MNAVLLANVLLPKLRQLGDASARISCEEWRPALRCAGLGVFAFGLLVRVRGLQNGDGLLIGEPWITFARRLGETHFHPCKRVFRDALVVQSPGERRPRRRDVTVTNSFRLERLQQVILPANYVPARDPVGVVMAEKCHKAFDKRLPLALRI